MDSQDDYKKELVDLLTQFAKTGGRARQRLSAMGIDFETRWGLVTKLSFDDTIELSPELELSRNALRRSYNELVKENAHPRIYDWVAGAVSQPELEE